MEENAFTMTGSEQQRYTNFNRFNSVPRTIFKSEEDGIEEIIIDEGIFNRNTFQRPLILSAVNSFNNEIFRDHCRYAATCFNPDEVHTFTVNIDVLKEIGFVKAVTEKTVVFVHRTFADYFYVHYLINNLTNDFINHKEHKEKIIDYLDTERADNEVATFIKSILVCDSARKFQLQDDNVDKLCECLLLNKTDYCDEFGKTPLHIACEIGAERCAKHLIGKGMYLNHKDDLGATPLLYAVENNFYNIAEWLIQNDACDTNVATKSGKTCFHFAAKNNNIKIINLLLERSDGSINIQTRDCRETPLHWAIKHGNEEAVVALINSGKCILSLASDIGDTCLHYAVAQKRITIVKLLLKDPSCPADAENNQKVTALHYIFEMNISEVVLLLLDVLNIFYFICLIYLTYT